MFWGLGDDAPAPINVYVPPVQGPTKYNWLNPAPVTQPPDAPLGPSTQFYCPSNEFAPGWGTAANPMIPCSGVAGPQSTGGPGKGGSNAGPGPTACNPPLVMGPNGTCVLHQLDPVLPLPTPTPTPVSPTTSKRAHRQRQRPSTPSQDICPIRGYVSRPIPGADEYQDFKCTPGQAVRIDPGVAAAGAAGAYQREGMGPAVWTGQQSGWGFTQSGLPPGYRIPGMGRHHGRAGFAPTGLADISTDLGMTGDTGVPTWLLAAVVVGGFLLMNKKRR